MFFEYFLWFPRLVPRYESHPEFVWIVGPKANHLNDLVLYVDGAEQKRKGLAGFCQRYI